MALIYAGQLEDLDVDEMQETHDEEIVILNDLDRIATEYFLDKSKLGELELKIEEYLKHLKEHFLNEEKLMRKYDFPSYDMHKIAHDTFLMDFSITINQWRKFGNVDKVINFIRKSPDWIVLHIKTVDAPTASYIAKKMELEKKD